MINRYVLIGIAAGVFFAGIGIGYAIFINSYNPYMMFQNQQMFNQMMSINPQMMNQWMTNMLQDPNLNQQMMGMMMQNPTFMQEMMQNQQFQQNWMGPWMMQHNFTGTSIVGKSTTSQMMSSASQQMPFNPDVPINIPVLEGNYNGTKVYFIHTEVSSKDIADMMTTMTNFPTIHNPNLTSIPAKDLDKVYVFTNGVPRPDSTPRPHGGGPFGFQEDVFDSIPDQKQYRQFKVVQLVKWNEGSNPRVFTSVDEILQAQANGELTVQGSDVVVNLPFIVWQSQDGKKQVASEIEKIFLSMPGIKGEVVNVNDGNFIVTLKFKTENG